MQIHIHTTWDAIDPAQWNKLLAAQDLPTPFMRWEYLNALQTSNSATPQQGWDVRIITIWRTELVAACALYFKPHSYGEYVFDFAWANAYAQHGLAYYPKAVIAVPFTPVPGSRLLALDVLAKGELVKACNQLVRDAELSSLHLLFASPADQAIRASHPAFMPRNTTQFHWTNGTHRYANFDDFLTHLNQEKRKKIKQERRKVAQAGVTFRPIQGVDMTKADWDFFYRCYERTYLEHNNLPYLTPEFFSSMASDMPENWLMLLGEIEGQPIAASLIAVQSRQLPSGALERVAYGRYWGALARVDCLHFEACYYQPIAWCIANGYDRFEGGAQGEHKMARALLPIEATSLHQIAHPAFAEAIERFLDRERAGVANYMSDLAERSPMRQTR